MCVGQFCIFQRMFHSHWTFTCHIQAGCLLTINQGSHDLLILKFKDIFKDQFSTKVYSMSSITAIFNVYLCDNGTVIR